MKRRSTELNIRYYLAIVVVFLLTGCETYEYSGLGPSSYSGYDPGYSLTDYAHTLNSNYNNTWNNTSMTGTWSVPSDVYLDPVTHQAQVPITVTWSNKDPQAFDRLQIFCKSDDPTKPCSGLGWVQIGTNDPVSGSKTTDMTISGFGSGQATFTIHGATLAGAFAGYGESHRVTVHGN